MSFFSKVFGGDSKKKSGAPSAQEAIQKLRDMEEMLNKKEEFLEKKIEKEIEIAKKNAAKNKRVALQALKRKKKYESQLRQIDGTLTTIEYQREALENANTNADVLSTMGLAAAAMKNAHKNMDVDQVNDLMDDIQEQQEVANQISEAISNPIGFGQDIDEDELAKELEDLEQEELDKDMLNINAPSTADLPEVPTAEPSKPAKVLTQEDEDLKELASWAS